MNEKMRDDIAENAKKYVRHITMAMEYREIADAIAENLAYLESNGNLFVGKILDNGMIVDGFIGAPDGSVSVRLVDAKCDAYYSTLEDLL